MVAHHVISKGRGWFAGETGDEVGGWGQVKLQLSRIALGSAVTLSLVGGSLLTASDAMAQCVTGHDNKGEPILPAAVMITGGTITNETIIDITADAGTSISDASGGNNNLASPVVAVAKAGATSRPPAMVAWRPRRPTAARSRSRTSTPVATPGMPSRSATPPARRSRRRLRLPRSRRTHRRRRPRAEKVVALPDTGVGIGDASALFALITSAGAAAASLGLRRR